MYHLLDKTTLLCIFVDDNLVFTSYIVNRMIICNRKRTNLRNILLEQYIKIYNFIFVNNGHIIWIRNDTFDYRLIIMKPKISYYWCD